MIEIWKPVKEFEGLYEVSNLGQVRSLNYKRTKGTKILKLVIDKDGYLRVNLYKNGKQYNKKVHRLVTAAFIPNPEGKTEVNHIDGNKTNNRVENLEWVTHSENIQHAWESGLCEPLTGENHPFYGKHHTEETKNKISEALKGKLKSAGKLPTGEKLVWRYAEDLKEKIK